MAEQETRITNRMVQKSRLRSFVVVNIDNQVTFVSPSIFYYTRVREMHLYCCPQRVTFGFCVINVQGDSKRWTQLKSIRRLNTRQTVGCGIPSSLLALRVDSRELRSKLS